MRIGWRARRPEDSGSVRAAVVALLLIGLALACLQWLGVSICLFHRLTGLPCLACGSTRAAVALLSGHPLLALRLQPLATVAGLLLGACVGLYAYGLFALRRVVWLRLEPPEWRVFGLGVLGLAVLNWIYLVRCGI